MIAIAIIIIIETKIWKKKKKRLVLHKIGYSSTPATIHSYTLTVSSYVEINTVEYR